MLGATYVKRHPRTGGYYFRRRVPDHLKPTIGTVEIIRSLATKSLDEAKRRSRTLADATDALFDEAEGRDSSGETVSQPAGWHSEFIAKWLESVSGRHGDAVPAPIVVSLPPEASAPPPEPSPPSVQQLPPQPQPILPPQRIATVRDVFDRYLSEFDRRTRTEQAWRRHVDMFLELSGLTWETNIHTVSDAHVEDFILALRKLPSRRQGAKFKKLTLMQIIDRFGAAVDVPKLDQRSINVKVDALRAVFYYAQRHKYRTDNPFVGKVSKRAAKRVKPKPRLPFDADELAMIFGSDIFQMPPHQWEGKQWLAVIALYAGARMEEIGQLRVGDYRVRHGIPYFAITTVENDDGDDQPEKSLKTAGSEREIPVHPVLIKLGLTRHVQRMKAIGEKRMFPGISGNGGEITASYSKWFGRFLTKLGITSPQKVFHSFRHTFKDGCRNSGVPREIAEVLMGHAGRTVGDSYGDGYRIDVLAEHIGKVRFNISLEPT
jgi:integrase